jgi:putative Mn2+ efflux pump MntP
MKKIKDYFVFFIIFILPWLLQFFNYSNKFTQYWSVLSFLLLILIGICYLYTFYDKQRKKVDNKEQQSTSSRRPRWDGFRRGGALGLERMGDTVPSFGATIQTMKKYIYEIHHCL